MVIFLVPNAHFADLTLALVLALAEASACKCPALTLSTSAWEIPTGTFSTSLTIQLAHHGRSANRR